MTWKELEKEAKKIGYEYSGKLEDGCVFKINCYIEYFATDRTPDQMLAIMKALQ